MKVNDKAQIAACSRTFTLDDPLETQRARQHILQRSNNFFGTLRNPSPLEQTATSEGKIIVKSEQHQEAGETNCFTCQNP